MNFSSRNTDPEYMDDPHIEGSLLQAVLRDINRANRLLGGIKITIEALDELIKENPRDSYTIVDMGCGDGAMLREIALFYRKKKLKVSLIGMDLSEKALTIGQLKSSNFSEITFAHQDILQVEAEKLQCDILLCTLTMHHFADEQISTFLKQFRKLASIGIIVNDLQRSRIAYYLFKGYSALFIKTKIAKHDGLISIKSGFTREELNNFSDQISGLSHFIQWKWAFRYVWVMRKNRQIQ